MTKFTNWLKYGSFLSLFAVMTAIVIISTTVSYSVIGESRQVAVIAAAAPATVTPTL